MIAPLLPLLRVEIGDEVDGDATLDLIRESAILGITDRVYKCEYEREIKYKQPQTQ